MQNRESEPKGTGILSDLKNVLENHPEQFGDELNMAKRAIRISETELSQEGSLSEESMEVLTDYYNEFRPKTEAELAADIDKAADWIKSELDRMEYLEDTINQASGDFRALLTIMYTGKKIRVPNRIAEEFLKDYLQY